MHSSEIDAIVHRLVDNPRDEEALAFVRRAGELDPKTYAVLLERVGAETADAIHSSHWLTEAASVWATTLGDAHRAARVLMAAIDRDPTHSIAAERLARLYRTNGDRRGLIALLERRAKGLAPLASTSVAIREELVAMHEELGQLWSAPPLVQPRKALEHYRRAIDFDPTSVYAIYNARELHKAASQWPDVFPLYEMELALEQDPMRRMALLHDEAASRRLAGDLRGATRAIARAREHAETDPDLQHEHASLVLERLGQGEEVAPAERKLAAELFVQLASTFAGEHARAYAESALHLEPGHSRARQLLAAAADGVAGDRPRADADGSGARDGIENRAVLEQLVDDAARAQDHAAIVAVLGRLDALTESKEERIALALREAESLAHDVGDVDAALARYRSLLADIEPTCRAALQAIADLEQAREHPAAAIAALTRELDLVDEVPERTPIAVRLARLHEQLGDCATALQTLEAACHADPGDHGARRQLVGLCERAERWARLADLLPACIDAERDDALRRSLALTLTDVLATRLGRPADAFAALVSLADLGDPALAERYRALGDALELPGAVADGLAAWWLPRPDGEQRTASLRAAFDRYIRAERPADALALARDLLRADGADASVADAVERLALRAGDRDALVLAHAQKAARLAPAERADEVVRQAEVRAEAGFPRDEAIRHGERGLPALGSLDDAMPLLGRLAQLASEPRHVVDLYERHAMRAANATERARALTQAADAAVCQGQADRAQEFLRRAFDDQATDDVLAVLEEATARVDATRGSNALCGALAGAMAARAVDARGPVRAALLRRASRLAQSALGSVDRAFGWLTHALLAHVDVEALEILEQLGTDTGQPGRVEESISQALGGAASGPQRRLLLERRARLRRDRLGDRDGAVGDLMRLHAMAPHDAPFLEELAGLLAELGDRRALVRLLEGQILRSRDAVLRADLARRVARLWERELGDPREAADAWRRVLRTSPEDAEAAVGLKRAKAAMLQAREEQAPEPRTPGPAAERPRNGTAEPLAPSAIKPVLELPSIFDDEDGEAEAVQTGEIELFVVPPHG